MATVAYGTSSVPFEGDQPFFVKFAIAIGVVTVACFLQLVVRGFTDPRTQPIWVHAHAFMMVGWLALFATQNVLATRNRRLHALLGRFGLVLALAIVPMGWFVVLRSFQLHRNPPDYVEAWALAQEIIETVAFIGLVVAGVLARRNPQYHRRLLLGATLIVAINPALSRTLPPAFAGGPQSGWLIAAAEVALLALLARHDRKVLGAIHPATIAIGVVILGAQMAMIAGGYSPALAGLASYLAQA